MECPFNTRCNTMLMLFTDRMHTVEAALWQLESDPHYSPVEYQWTNKNLICLNIIRITDHFLSRLHYYKADTGTPKNEKSCFIGAASWWLSFGHSSVCVSFLWGDKSNTEILQQRVHSAFESTKHNPT